MSAARIRNKGENGNDSSNGSLGKFYRNVFVLTLTPMALVAVLPFAVVHFDMVPSAGAAASLDTARPPEVSIQGASDSGASPHAVEAAQREVAENGDSARVLLRRLNNGNYESREEVACGRFLADFDRQSLALEDVDRRQLRLAHHGPGWVLIEAPYRPPAGAEALARIRLVAREGSWKVEDLSVLRGRSF
jgi:hypothetical protein